MMTGNIDKAQMARVKEAMERVRSGESQVEEVELPSGGVVTFRRDPEDPHGIRIETEEGDDGARPSISDDPKRKEMMEKIGAASLRIRSGESEEEEIVLDTGDTVRMERDPDVPQGFTVESKKGGMSLKARAFDPTSERPHEYAEDLPFVPECPVSISVFDSEEGPRRGRQVAWMRPSDPQGVLDQIKEQLREMGWEEGETSRASSLLGKTVSTRFTLGSRERTLMFMALGEVHQIMMLENMDTHETE